MKHLSTVSVAAALIILPQTLWAEEPSGCAAFKWPLAHEAQLLQASDKPLMASGGNAEADGKAFTLTLVDSAVAGLPEKPERAPKMMPSTAGYLRFSAPKAAGMTEIAVSQAAWIDVIQDGHAIKPSAFSGARDCPGVRKSIKLSLAAMPFVVQISGTTSSAIGMIVEPIAP